MRAGAFGLKAAIAFAALMVFGSVGTQPAHAVPVDCSTIDTFGEWDTASNAAVDPGCLDGDKVYTLVDTDIPAGAEIEFQNFADETHIVIVHGDVDGPLELSLEYTIQALESEIISVGVDADVSGTAIGTTVTKEIYDIDDFLIETLTSLDGVPDSTDVAFSEDFLRIIETISIVDGSHVSSVSNEITQATIPEPVTLALFGLGLVGLGVMRRRRLG